MSKSEQRNSVVVRALRTQQGEGVDVYSFFLPGADVMRVADITRIERDEDSSLKGFQRKEIRSHVNSIAEFLDQGSVIFPNALILAFSPEIEFKQSRGPVPRDLESGVQSGTLKIPVHEEGQRVSWIVDGQQRSLALSKTKNKKLPVPVVGFVSHDLQVQREQFILVNKAKPLPNRLINELLPETGVLLPRELAARKIPSEICNLLNRDRNSPFCGLIRRASDNDKGRVAVITDTALINVVKNSISNPLGALSPFKGTQSEPANIEAMYSTMCKFWSAARDTFPEAWGPPPTKSRLMHSAGIQAMGTLMDRLMAKASGSDDADRVIRSSLQRIAPRCCWTSGVWEGLELKWDEVQSVPRHIRGLADVLVRLDYELSQNAA